jgi:hypothetical protein
MKYQFDPERLAYWYLRLNGFLTIENFIVHPEVGVDQRTDIDLMALRFPHRREAFRNYGGNVTWMKDDPRFASKKIPFAAFVEVASGQCKLNGPMGVKTLPPPAKLFTNQFVGSVKLTDAEWTAVEQRAEKYLPRGNRS